MKIYILSAFFLILVLVLHILGLNFLYGRFQMFDIVTHIVGGIGVALFFLAFLSRNLTSLKRKRVILLGCVLFAGIVWEIIEAYYNIAGFTPGTTLYYIDTFKDLTNDMIGGFLVAILYRYPLSLEEHE